MTKSEHINYSPQNKKKKKISLSIELGWFFSPFMCAKNKQCGWAETRFPRHHLEHPNRVSCLNPSTNSLPAQSLPHLPVVPFSSISQKDTKILKLTGEGASRHEVKSFVSPFGGWSRVGAEPSWLANATGSARVRAVVVPSDCSLSIQVTDC